MKGSIDDPWNPQNAAGSHFSDEPMVKAPTAQERAASWKALSKLHPGNRFRLMFGQPLLPQSPNQEFGNLSIDDFLDVDDAEL